MKPTRHIKFLLISGAGKIDSSTFRREWADSVHRLNEFARPIDQRLFGPNPCSDVPPIFLVGMGRSGSTLAFQTLTSALNVSFLPRLLDYSYGSANFFFRLLRAQLEHPKTTYKSNRGTIEGLLSPSEAVGFWQRWFPSDAFNEQLYDSPLSQGNEQLLSSAVYTIQGHFRRSLLVKCFYLSLAVTPIAAAIPNARFILVLRNPLDVATSIIKIRGESRHNQWWSIRPPGYQMMLNKPISDQVLWQISETLRLCRQQLELLPASRWRAVQYEELCDDPRQVIGEIGRWLADSGVKSRKNISLPKKFPLPSNARESIIHRLMDSSYYSDALKYSINTSDLE